MNPTWLYVGALYSLAVWLVRRYAALPRRIALFFYLLVLAFLWRPMTQAYVDVPVDCVTHIPPWSFIERAPTANCQMNDIVTQMVPWAKEVRDGWKSLRAPLWSAHSGSGSVLLANPQSGALSPLRLAALPLPLGDSFTAEAAMKLLIALTFTFLFCKRRGYSDLASAAGAAAFGFCTFLVVWLHFGQATVAAYLPAVLLAIDLLFERVTARRFAFAVAVGASVVFAGHPETALHMAVMAVLMSLWMVTVEGHFSWRFVAALAGATVVAALVAAPLLVPFSEALIRSSRYQSVKAIAPGIGFVDLRSAILLVQPSFFGASPAEQPWGPAAAESISGFAGILGFAGWIALLADAIARRRWRGREMFFVFATPLLLALILNWPVVGSSFHALFWFAVNSRLRLLFAFVMAMQVAAAINLIERERRWPVLIGITGTAALLILMLVAVQFPNPTTRDHTVLAMLPSVIVLVIAAFAAGIPASRPGATLVAVGGIVFELWAAGIRWNPAVDQQRMYPPTPLIRQLQALKASSSTPFRIVGRGSMLYPNTGVIYGFDDIRIHDPMANARYLEALRVAAGYDTRQYFANWHDTETPMLDFLNVRFVITDPGADLPDQARYALVYDGKDGRIYRNRNVLPRFFAVRNVVLESNESLHAQRLSAIRDFGATAIVKSLPGLHDDMKRALFAPHPSNAAEPSLLLVSAHDTEFRLHVDAPRVALIVSSQPLWPGWHIDRNGTRVEPLLVNGAFLGFIVPPGRSEIRIDYSPATFYGGVAVSLMAVLAILITNLRRRRSASAG